MATEQAEKILKYVEANGAVSTLTLAQLWNEDHQKVIGIVNSLLSLGEVRFHSFKTFFRSSSKLPYVFRSIQ